MPIPLIWGITVAFGFLAWGVFAAQYIWPAISKRERAEALRPILMLHGFRYVGLAVLIPGVVSPQLPDTVFARGQMYCAAKTPHARKPKATVMPQIRGIGMMRSFVRLVCKKVLHFTKRRATPITDDSNGLRDSCEHREVRRRTEVCFGLTRLCSLWECPFNQQKRNREE